MTQQEIETILNFNLDNHNKSLLLDKLFYTSSAVALYLAGGSIGNYDKFLETLPDNLKKESDNYDMKRYWELSGLPKDFKEALDKGLFVFDKKDNLYHSYSIKENTDRGVIEFMKSKSHPTIDMEYEDAKSKGFLEDHDIIDDPERPGYLMYISKHQKGGNIKTLKPTESIQIGDKEYDIEIADTPESRRDGLSRVKRLKEDEGMLFVFERPTTDYFTMKDTDIDLDIVFIDEEGVVISVESVEARDPNPVVCKYPYKFVLEVCIDSEIQPGDELSQEDGEFTDEQKETISKSRMLVLDSNGDVQMKLVGGERIVSRIKTRLLIKAALKAYKTDNDSNYRRVGKLIINELDAQDNRKPLYVEK